jgi:hypothetical protein
MRRDAPDCYVGVAESFMEAKTPLMCTKRIDITTSLILKRWFRDETCFTC